MRKEVTDLQKLFMKQKGLNPDFPVVPRFHSPADLSVRGIIEKYPDPRERDAYVGRLLVDVAPDLAEGVARSIVAKENRLAANPNEVAKLDLSHVVFRGE